MCVCIYIYIYTHIIYIYIYIYTWGFLLYFVCGMESYSQFFSELTLDGTVFGCNFCLISALGRHAGALQDPPGREIADASAGSRA